MARKKTREELETRIHELEAYREAFWALQRGERPVKVTSGEGDCERTAWVLGASRACGGVVLLDPDGSCVTYAEPWAGRMRQLDGVDPYLADLGRKVFRIVADAVKARVRA